MALAGGHVGDQERHLQARVGGPGRLLGDAEVLADHLVAEGQVVAVGLGLDDYALLAHLECLGLAVGEQVGVVGLGLLDGVGAVGQRVLGRLGRVGLLGVVPSGRDGHDRLAGIVALAVDDDAVGALVHDGELDAVQVGAHGGAVVGAADGLGPSELDVVLLHHHAAAHDVVHDGSGLGEVDHDALVAHLEVACYGALVEVPDRRHGLLDVVAAVGQAVGCGLGDAVGVGCDLLHDLAGLVELALDVDRVLALVGDGEGRALEGGVALLVGAGLGVLLGDGHASAHDVLVLCGRAVMGLGVAELDVGARLLGVALGLDHHGLGIGGQVVAGGRLHLGEAVGA